MQGDFVVSLELLTDEVRPELLEDSTKQLNALGLTGNNVAEIKNKLLKNQSSNAKFDHGLDSIPKNKVRELTRISSIPVSTDDQNGEITAEEAAKKAQKKMNEINHLCEEIVETEISYNQVLDILLTIFDRVKQQFPAELKIWTSVFKDINSLKEVHKLIMNRFLFLQSNGEMLFIPKIFQNSSNQILPTTTTDTHAQEDKFIRGCLKIYTNFNLNYSNNLQELYRLNKDLKIKQLASSIILEHSNTVHHSKDLPGLYMQVQARVTRYELLMKGFDKNLPPESELREAVRDAIKFFASINSGSQDALITREKCEKAIEKWDKLSFSCPQSLPVNTEFIKDGPTKKLPRRALGKKPADRHLFLFTSHLLLTETANPTGFYTVKSPFELISLNIEHVNEDEDLPTDRCFRLRSSSRTIEVQFNNEKEMEIWFEKISTAIEAAQNTQRIRNQRLSTVNGQNMAATWVKDEYVSMCVRCNREFTTIFRRHHCRKCGNVICYKCSDYSMSIDSSSRKQRVCLVCYYQRHPSQIRSILPEVAQILKKFDDKNRSDGPLLAKYLHWAVWRGDHWNCKSERLRKIQLLDEKKMVLRPSEDEAAEETLHRLKVDRFVKVNCGTQSHYFEDFSPPRHFVLLMPDSCIKIYAAKNDNQFRDLLVTLGLRIFYLDSRSEYKKIPKNGSDKRKSSIVPPSPNYNNKQRRATFANAGPQLSCKMDDELRHHSIFQERRRMSKIDTEEESEEENASSYVQQSNIRLPRALKEAMKPVRNEVLAALRNDCGFLMVPANTDSLAHYFEAPSKELRDEWIATIRSTVISSPEKSEQDRQSLQSGDIEE
ncbi:FYVE, RhoGEF and PH domain-containing protein 4 [Cichlidogyrus casuarinus]|uniref:FYVE, RhoGEF and PH domain-containing protein 4 n=1 Tax=Cichlidogyrus casuarinus TaxID=1844966 RepID=A0ABD2QAJ7_9PLAT